MVKMRTTILKQNPNVYPGMEKQLLNTLNQHGMLSNHSLKMVT